MKASLVARFPYRNTRQELTTGAFYVIELEEVWSCQAEALTFTHVLVDSTFLQHLAYVAWGRIDRLMQMWDTTTDCEVLNYHYSAPLTVVAWSPGARNGLSPPWQAILA